MTDAFILSWLFNKQEYEACLNMCTAALEKNQYNQTAWILKCKCLAYLSRVDDLELDNDEFDATLDYVAQAALPRPGTSLRKLATAAGHSQDPAAAASSFAIRPMSGHGRVVTGYARPMTTVKDLNGSQRTVLRSSNERMTLSSSGRMNLVTPSLVNEPGGPFINLERLDLKKYASKPLLSMDMLTTRLYLAKVYLKLDQPSVALQIYEDTSTNFPGTTAPLVSMARIHEELFDLQMSIKMYKKILHIDSSHVEALASLAANYFYDDQPEVALRYYRRLLQMGKESSAEIWNNMGLCTFYSQQYDLAIPCFERALSFASDDAMLSDVWYNIGHVACSTGDLEFAYKSFKICVSSNSNHAEGWNNLGVLEIQMAKSVSSAHDHFIKSSRISAFIYEPFYNLALATLEKGDIQSSLQHVQTALANYPHHYSGKALQERLQQIWPPSLGPLSLDEGVAALSPLLINIVLCGVVVLGVFVGSTIVGNYSQVDRLWSVTPWVYSWVFFGYSYLRGYGFDPRLFAMCVVSTIWGLRLTYNFWRKGGYKAGEEDYRWPALRKILTNPIVWHIFAFSFISLYQNLLLLLIAIPAHVAFSATEANANGSAGFEPWTAVDTAATVFFMSMLALETWADQQQWAFQEKKWAMIKSGKTLASLPVPYKYGFLTTGLFSLCRHPNFIAEFSMWWAFYLYSVGASGVWLNWTIIGAVLLTMLFQGSTAFTESITEAKYPLYKVYQKYTRGLIPLPPKISFEKFLAKQD
ncbi:Tetratricopeptide repeat protein 8 [Dinochytrium kinnereticum]|nr:Tetratricopeptide repeat protein 8 [Dinochytrium kinnereticum]